VRLSTRWYSPIALALVGILAVSAQAAGQTDTVRAGGSGYQSLELPLGIDSTHAFMVRDSTRVKVMTYVETISETPEGYLIVGENIRPDGASVTLDSVAVARGTLAPFWHSDVTPTGRMRVTYDGGTMRGTAVDTAGGESAVEAPVAPGAFDYSIGRLIINQLPLAPGYGGVLLTHDVKRGAIPVGFRVVGEESVTVGGRTADAWKVEMDYGTFKAERWIDRETKADLRTRVVAGGREMIVEPAGAGS
jgi:hypothetical protein